MRVVQVTAVDSKDHRIPRQADSLNSPPRQRFPLPIELERLVADAAAQFLIAQDPDQGRPDRGHPDPGPVPDPHRGAGLDRGRGGRRVGSKARSRRTPLPSRHRTCPVRRCPKRRPHVPVPHAKPPTASTDASVSHCGRPTCTGFRWRRTDPSPIQMSLLRQERRLSNRRTGGATFQPPRCVTGDVPTTEPVSESRTMRSIAKRFPHPPHFAANRAPPV